MIKALETPVRMSGEYRRAITSRKSRTERKAELLPTPFKRPLPAGFADSTFDGVNESLRETLRETINAGPYPLFLYGGVGSGKTSAMSLAHACWPTHSYWYRLEEFVTDITTCRQSKNKSVTKTYNGMPFDRTESMLWKFAASPNLWCIDDFGTRTVSAAGFEIVFRLLNERKDKPTIITSNLSPEQLAELHDERIASRLRAGTVIEVTAPDRRKGRRLKV